MPGTLRDFHQASAEFDVVNPKATQLPGSHASFCSQPIERPVRILRCAKDSSYFFDRVKPTARSAGLRENDAIESIVGNVAPRLSRLPHQLQRDEYIPHRLGTEIKPSYETLDTLSLDVAKLETAESRNEILPDLRLHRRPG